MSLANVSTSNTVATWLARTNQLIYQLDENSTLATAAYNATNVYVTTTAEIAANLFATNTVFSGALAGSLANNEVLVAAILDSANTISNTYIYTNGYNWIPTIANTASDTAVYAAGLANTISATAVGAFGKANTACTVAVAAFVAANSAVTDFSPAYNTANTALTTASAAYGVANIGSTTAVAAFAKANTANNIAVGNTAASVFAQRASRSRLNFIPGTNIVINVDDDSTGDRVNVSITSTAADGPGVAAAFDTANAAGVTAVAAFAKANSATTLGAAAFGKANSALANTTGTLAGTLTLTGSLVAVTNVQGVYIKGTSGIVFPNGNTITNYTVSTAAPSGGNNGDIWLKIS